MSRRCTGQTITTLPSLASRAWHARCVRPSPSTRAPRARCRRPRARWVTEALGNCDVVWPRWRSESDMRIFTVHEPDPRKGEVAADPERIRFIRDGFHFWAFLLG